MPNMNSAVFTAFLMSIPSLILGGQALSLPGVTVGQNLEAVASIKLTEPAPGDGLEITVTSGDPSRVLFSTAPDKKGSASIVAKVQPGRRESLDFYVQGFANTGTASYTATANGLESATAMITLGPSGIVITTGTLGDRPVDRLATVAAAGPRKIAVYPALLDSSMHYVAPQLLVGGANVSIAVTSSDAGVGTLLKSPLTMSGGEALAWTGFQPVNVGTTNLSVSAPPGFQIPAEFSRLTATVNMPGIGIKDVLTLGKNLQFCEMLFIGEKAPRGGLAVSLTSDNPNLLISDAATSQGSKSFTVTIPEGQNRAPYCFQSLGDSGTAQVMVTAQGHRTRTVTVTLTPSGVLLAFRGPDEAELTNKEVAEKEHGIVIDLSETATFTLYTAWLHPVHHRGADVTVQSLRPGVSVTAELNNSNPAVGTITSPATITDRNVHVQFKPLSRGKTVISLSTPEGFTTPGNANAYTVVVR